MILLVGLPVFVLSGADVAWRSYQLDPGEQVTRDLGAAEASLEFYGGVVKQSPDGGRLGTTSRQVQISDIPRAELPLDRLAAIVSPSAKAVRTGVSSATIHTPDGWAYVNLEAYDYDSSIAHGRVIHLQGRSPQRPNEVGLTKDLADKAHVRLGDTVRLSSNTAGGPEDRTLVGIVGTTSSNNPEIVYVPTSATSIVTDGTPIMGLHLKLLVSGAPIDWPTLLKLNQAGYLVDSRFVRMHPPSIDQIPKEVRAEATRSNRERIVTITLIGGMALLEIVLLAGPAFAVGARRDKRQLGLVAAIGGGRRDLRRIVLSRGLVLGASAGVIGVIAGPLTAIAARNLIANRIDRVPGQVKIHLPELGLLILVSILTSLAAAAVPAFRAAKTDVVAALTSRRDPTRRLKRVPIIGAITACAGIGITMVGASVLRKENVMLGGILVTELGLITCIPTLLGLLSHAARYLPLSGRIALRDAGRNRTSAAPAIAAVTACVVAAVALSIAVASRNESARRSYNPQAAVNDAVSSVGTTSDYSDAAAQARTNKVIGILKASMPVASIDVVSQAQVSCIPALSVTSPLPAAPPISVPPPAEPSMCNNSTFEIGSPACINAVNDPSCAGGFGSDRIPVDDGSNVDAFFSDPVSVDRARTALHAGKIIVSSPSSITNGVTAFTISDGTGTPSHWRNAPVEYIPIAYGGFLNAVIPTSLAKELGLKVIPYQVVAHNLKMPTAAQQRQAADGLAGIDENAYLYVERGYHDPTAYPLLGLVAAGAVLSIAASGIATALANVDGARDLQTLAHIGANRRTRRKISMSRAATITLMGIGLGLPAGFLPAWAWVSFIRANFYTHILDAHISGNTDSGSVFYSPLNDIPQMPFIVPWMTVAIILIAVPACAIAAAGLFTRSRVPVAQLR